MEHTTVKADGRDVAFHMDASIGTTTRMSAAEAGEFVVKAIVEAASRPLAAVVQAVTLTATRTVYEITVELSIIRQEAATTRRIALKAVTARLISDYLMKLANDENWDPEVKQHLRRVLISDLTIELDRLALRS